jgi:hypothetical protein
MAIILPDVQNVVRLIHKGQNQGTPWVNTMHLQGTAGPFSEATLQAVATAAHQAYFNAFIPQLNVQTSLLSTTAVDLTSRTSGFAVDDTVHAGTVSAPVNPPLSVAYCISWTIADRYRGGHPRMYLCAASTSDYTGGRLLTTTKQTALSAAASGYLTSLGAIVAGSTTWYPVAVRYWSQHALLPTPLQRYIVDAAVHQRIDSQRRRLGKETG